MTTTLDDLKNFDVQGATLTFWAVRRSIPTGRPPVFTPRHVATTTELDEKLRSAMKNEFSRIEEVQEYGLLTENNESSALSIAAEDTHVGQIVDKTVEDTAQNRADGLDKIKNSFCYVIKLVSGDAVVRGVCKTDASWQIRKSESWIPVFFDLMSLASNRRLQCTYPNALTLLSLTTQSSC
ncbi:MAG: hypothetical protein OXF31_13340 [Gammaproteobacteria bacterium]|nr:hypothetical protein [Gammaproteobacteria bacterium]